MATTQVAAQQKKELTPQEKRQRYVDSIQSGLLQELEKNKAALPAGFRPERFTINAITVLKTLMADNRTKGELQKVDPKTIPMALAKAAYLGLDYMNGECYAIPYGGEVNMQTDYKGEIKVCKRFNKNVKNIYAKLVMKDDAFQEVIINGEPQIKFEPVPFVQPTKENIKGAFAIVTFKDGSMLYETMGIGEIEHIRNTYSKAKNSPAWRDSYGEMCKKTVLRRLCKLIDLDFDENVQLAAFNDAGDAKFSEILPQPTVAEPTEEDGPLDVFADAKVIDDQPKEDPKPAPAPEVPQNVVDAEYSEFEQNFEQEELPFK